MNMVDKTLNLHICRAYDAINVWEADIIYLYTDFRSFGTYLDTFENKHEFLVAFIDPLLQRDITIVVPTFTYTTSGEFHVETTSSKLGALNTWILKQPNVQRSEHPLFSYAAHGSLASFVLNVGKSAFGNDCVFERLMVRKSAFLHIGRPVSMGNTCVHYVEHQCGATYRIHKAFRTRVFRGKECVGTDYSAFVRRLDVPEHDFFVDFEEGAELLYKSKSIREVGDSGKFTNFSFYWCTPTIDFFMDVFNKDQKIFINENFLQY